ncbi:archaemetzincin [Anaeramoeba flamelloides]|uniref:Archaemetzincin n=1 Tax=Anaeramoeba flamelloides TaxID=1746091 RepID=A0AAV7YIG6_9EUKA|nr:archaemetzincin [Anaeramoeba flamelloides]KAJ6245445.1 archaemetzincin [Anaeramoeba flamelloides]
MRASRIFTEKERNFAVGNLKTVPQQFQKVFTITDQFEPITNHEEGSWLYSHHEEGQTYKKFQRVVTTVPTEERNTIYLQPIGEFDEEVTPKLDLLSKFTSAFFSMPVSVSSPIKKDVTQLGIKTREYTNPRGRQLLSTDLLNLMFRQKKKNSDSFCTLAITMEDLYPKESWNFVFGQASLVRGVGVYSFARYDPMFYSSKRTKNWKKTLLRRSIKVLSHETGHMFGIHHCVFFNCAMNGSNHLDESDSRCCFLCPICLRKLYSSIKFDPIKRYKKLRKIYQEMGFDDLVEWIDKRLLHIEK